MGPKVFFLWGSLCCISFSFAYFLVPETKGLSLEQIDKMLEETTPRTSTKWVPHGTFAQEMGLTDEGITIAGSPATETESVENVVPEKQV
jgi:hypothetical protein